MYCFYKIGLNCIFINIINVYLFIVVYIVVVILIICEFKGNVMSGIGCRFKRDF